MICHLRLFLLVMVCGIGFVNAADNRNVSVQSGAGAEKRVALVIGNSAYMQGPLVNPVNDARAMAKRLRSLGFDVVLRENLKARDIGGVYREFRSKIAPGGVALVFYAGHGVQFKGQNYFPAVDADIHSEEDVPQHSLNLGTLLDNMEEAKAGVSLVFLDACRDNPFARRFRSGTRGLAKVEAASGMLIHYATRPGSVASDGEGQNGTYTEALLAQMSEPGVPVEQMLKRVANQVVAKTKGKQEPWVEGSLRGDFYFIFQGPTTIQVQQTPADPEGEAWRMAERSDSVEALDAYLREYPKGNYASAARVRLAAIRKSSNPTNATTISGEPMGAIKGEITIGTIQDLTGPLAGFGRALRYGMQMRVDEVNEAGGVNSRKLKLVAEDSGYDPQKGLLAAQKMVQQDKIFAMVGTTGAAVNLVIFPTLFDKGVMNLFPMSAAREMYEPLHKLKFSIATTYYDQMRIAVKWMVKARGAKKLCIIYQDDDFGVEVLKGAEDGLRDTNMTFTEKTSFTRGATSFSTQVSQMKAADCDTVVLGTIIRETIGTIGTAKKMGWNPNFIGSSAAYTDLIHKLGGKAMDGLYAMHQVAVPYADDSSKNVRDWFAAYKAKFNEEPGLFSAYGYAMMDMFAQTAKKAGASLTTDSFIRVLESTTYPRDFLGSPEYQFGPGQHLGNNKSKVGQIQNGRWVAVTNYLSP